MKSKLLWLILAGFMVASLSGCTSPDSGASASASTPDEESTSVSTPDVEPAPAPDEGSIPAPTPDREPAPVPDEEPASTPDEEPAPTPDEEPAPTPDEEPAPEAGEDAGPSLSDLLQLTEYALSQGDVNYDVSVENGGITVSVWTEGAGDALSSAAEAGFSVEQALSANGGETLLLLERNILELAGASGYGDLPVTVRLLDDRNLENVLLVISDGAVVAPED